MSKIELGWGSGMTELFLQVKKDGTLKVLDYEYETNKIHEICGGRLYYVSSSGLTGKGYIERLGSLIRVGFYRVDTTLLDCQCPQEIAEGIQIMLPYKNHWEEERYKVLCDYPVVIRTHKDLIYCNYFRNLKEVLEVLLSGKEFSETRVLKKKFAYPSLGIEGKVQINFLNFFGRSFFPWEFLTDYLEGFELDPEKERKMDRVHQIFRISHLENGKYVRYGRLGYKRYAFEILGTQDPLESVEEALPGWEFARKNMLYKLREKDVYIVGWKGFSELWEKKAERLCRFFPKAEKLAVRNYVMERAPKKKFEEFELIVPKFLFFLDQEKYFSEVRKNIEKKVEKEVLAMARQFLKGMDSKRILEAIPDDKLIRFEDSLEAGNCKPGTEAFIARNFPGRRETTVGELKKFWDNQDVIRVLRHVALRDCLIS